MGAVVILLRAGHARAVNVFVAELCRVGCESLPTAMGVLQAAYRHVGRHRSETG